MEKSAAPKVVTISPKRVFGLRTDVLGNIHFDAAETFIYPVAGVLALQELSTIKQKFLRFVEGSEPTIISLSPNRKYIAIAEKTATRTLINIYEIANLKKRKTLTLSGCPTNEPSFISFTHDSRNLVVLSKEPDAFLSIFSFEKAAEKNDSVFMGRASNSAQPGKARFLSCNPGDTAITAVGGEYLLKIMNKTEKGFGQIGTVKGDNILVTSLAWISSDILVAGTAETEILFIEGGDPKIKYIANDIEHIDLTKIPEGEDMLLAEPVEQTDVEKLDVVCITNFDKGFAFAIHNVVHVFEKETNFRFAKRTVLTIQPRWYDKDSYKISNMAVNAAEDTVIATTQHSQIYISKLFARESLTIVHFDFETLSEPLHVDKIIGLSLCSWKPIILTASKDQTVRIWNYATMQVELVKKYQLAISVIALHPSGMFAAIGFSDSLRFLQIQLDDLKVSKVFHYPNCTELEFSHQGHLLAAAYKKEIAIISIFTFEVLHVLRGHNGSVLSLVWSYNDSKLVSSGIDGAIYEWNVLCGERVAEIVQKGIEYRCIAISNDESSIIAITNTGVLREIVKSEVIREFKTLDASPVNAVALSRSDLMMFVGTDQGQLYNVQMPLGDTGGGTFSNFRFFQKAVTKVKITYDDRLLITASADGTLIVWNILNVEGKMAHTDVALCTFTDIMAERSDLIDKKNTIKALETRLEQQIEEFQYKIKNGDHFHTEQMRSVHESYCEKIAELVRVHDEMETTHAKERTDLYQEIADLEAKHLKVMADQEADFHEKIIAEYDKSAAIKRQMVEMKEEYELKLRTSAGELESTVQRLQEVFREQLAERQKLIDDLIEEAELKKQEFADYCRQVESDNDRNVVESQLNFEKRLKEESEQSVKWRSEAGVLKKRIATAVNEAEEATKALEALRVHHATSQQMIKEHLSSIDFLKGQVTDQDDVIKEKDIAINDLQKVNVELEKQRQVLSHNIIELKSQLQPLGTEIAQKREQINDMEKELEGLQKELKQVRTQLADMQDKYKGNAAELKCERQHSRTTKAQLFKVCGEIQDLAELIQRPEELKKAIRALNLKYADQRSITKTLSSEVQVQNEFLRQREHMEKLSVGGQTKKEKKKGPGETARLLKENIILTTELNKLRTELKQMKKLCTQMEAVIGAAKRKAISEAILRGEDKFEED